MLIDLLTDSGTGAMSSAQWGALMQGDETYAGSRSFYRFQRRRPRRSPASGTSSRRTRDAPPSASSSTRCCKPGDIVPNNNHFDTTRANIEVEGAEARDLVIAGRARSPSALHPFKGNIDLAALERLLDAATATASRS